MKILSLDIETTPNMVYTWGLFDQNIGLNQIVEPGGVVCVAAKFMDEKKTHFTSVWEHGKQGMAERIHALLEEADVVMHYNGRRFDLPHLNTIFLEHGLGQPKPFADIDLLTVVRRQFKFPSNKLEYVSKALGLSGKAETGGFGLWVGVMEGDPKAQAKMKKYNIRDVTVLEEMYEILKPWIPNHPNTPLYDGIEGALVCPVCTSDHVQRRGVYRTAVSVFQQYQCQGCTKWFRGPRRLPKVTKAIQ